jgi:hypothetical protein
MFRKLVISSNLHSVGYDTNTRVLEVEFNSGGIYRYSGVPDYIYENLMRANSKGTYFDEIIKNVYPFVEIT